MTPSDKQQLKAHAKAAAEFFYTNTAPTELKSFESIEKSVCQKMLEEIGSELGSFFFSSIRNSNRKIRKVKSIIGSLDITNNFFKIFWLKSLGSHS